MINKSNLFTYYFTLLANIRLFFFWLLAIIPTHLFAQSQVVLRSVTHRSPPYIDYWSYNEKYQPKSIISTTKDSSSVLMFYDFIRDQNNLLKTTEVKDVSYTTIYSFNYYYNGANQVERIEKLSDMDYDGKANDLDQVFTIKYDDQGRVVQLQIRHGSVLSRDFSFIWKDGNVVHVDNTDGELNYHMDLTYDAIPNALEAIKWEYITTTGNLEFYVTMFSKNNLVDGILYYAGMDTAKLEIRPEYDSEGLFKANRMEGVQYEYMIK